MKDGRRHRRGVRVAEGAALELLYTACLYRGFESLSLRFTLPPTPRPVGSLFKLEPAGHFCNIPQPVAGNPDIFMIHFGGKAVLL